MYLATEQAVRDALYEADKMIEAQRIEIDSLSKALASAQETNRRLVPRALLPAATDHLKLDAERYRWLRDDAQGRALSVAALDWTGETGAADAAVDAAMAAAPGIGAA